MTFSLLDDPKDYAVFIQVTPRQRYQIAEFDTLEEAEEYVRDSESRDKLYIARRKPMH